MQRMTKLFAVCMLTAGVAACQGGIAPQQQIVLPDGNAANGQQAFTELACTTCHSVRGVDLPLPTDLGPVKLVLGGKVSRVKSYGELVTSVINPSHRLARNLLKQEIAIDGESIMPIYNDVMTVTQLVDIVAFLQPTYERIERPGYRYPVYSYDKE